MSDPTSNQAPVDPFAADIAAFKAKQAEQQPSKQDEPKPEPQSQSLFEQKQPLDQKPPLEQKQPVDAKATPQLPPSEKTDLTDQSPEPQPPRDQLSQAPKESSWLERMKLGLSRSRGQMGEGLMTLLVGGREIDDELFEEIEDQLIMADLGLSLIHI